MEDLIEKANLMFDKMEQEMNSKYDLDLELYQLKMKYLFLQKKCLNRYELSDEELKSEQDIQDNSRSLSFEDEEVQNSNNGLETNKLKLEEQQKKSTKKSSKEDSLGLESLNDSKSISNSDNENLYQKYDLKYFQKNEEQNNVKTDLIKIIEKRQILQEPEKKNTLQIQKQQKLSNYIGQKQKQQTICKNIGKNVVKIENKNIKSISKESPQNEEEKSQQLKPFKLPQSKKKVQLKAQNSRISNLPLYQNNARSLKNGKNISNNLNLQKNRAILNSQKSNKISQINNNKVVKKGSKNQKESSDLSYQSSCDEKTFDKLLPL